jgi:hypothetical protein
LQIDYEKLAEYAHMTNPRSASNAWAKIKVKLLSATEGGPVTVATTTPKKGGPKKKAAAKSDNGDAEAADGESPTKKTPRKRAAKKQDVDGEETTPKKKGRPAKVKKSSDDETGSYMTLNSPSNITDASQLKPRLRSRTTSRRRSRARMTSSQMVAASPLSWMMLRRRSDPPLDAHLEVSHQLLSASNHNTDYSYPQTHHHYAVLTFKFGAGF